MTQKERVLAMLRKGPCTFEDFLQAYVSEYKARIYELKKLDYNITDKRYKQGKVWTLHEKAQRELF